MQKCRSVMSVFVLVILAAGSARGDVRLPGLISDGMVLQRGVPVNVWGWADEGEEVTVRFRSQIKTTTAEKGKWLVTLDPLRAGGPDPIVIRANNGITIHNVLVGEVWICSGQSNMQWPLVNTEDGERHVQEANHHKLRLFYVPRTKSDVPLDDVDAKWTPCTSKHAREFTAVGYFFGRDLHKALNVPVGLIHTSWGGSPAEVWCKTSVLEANPSLKVILDNHATAFARFEKARKDHAARVEQAKKEGKKPPGAPRPPWKPSELYNGMIAPLLPYAIKGAIWYQGESNASRAEQYRSLFPTMIRNWRQDWRMGDFPFLLVQLAPFMAIKEEPSESRWAELREAQLLSTRILPNVGMAVITDVGDEKNIHPRKKEPVGARLAIAAQAIAYGKRIVPSGPTYAYCEIRGNKIILHFDHVGSGLLAKDGPLKGFAIAGEDGQFVWADAVIHKDTVVVSSKEVPKPVAVRYGWADYPVVNLWNQTGLLKKKPWLPASPFRTDREMDDLSY